MRKTGNHFNRIILDRERNALLRLQMAENRNNQLEEQLNNLTSKQKFNWNIFVPVLVAVIGATASILGTAYSQLKQADLVSKQAESAQELQNLIAQQELIKLAVGAEEKRADANIKFLIEANLVPQYARNLNTALESGNTLSAPPAPVTPITIGRQGGGSVRTRPVERIIVSDTGSPVMHDLLKTNFNFIIDVNGEVIEGIPSGFAPACVTRFNQGTLCIGMVGSCWINQPKRNVPYSKAQKASLANKIKEESEKFNLKAEDITTRQHIEEMRTDGAQRPRCTRLHAELGKFLSSINIK